MFTVSTKNSPMVVVVWYEEWGLQFAWKSDIWWKNWSHRPTCICLFLDLQNCAIWQCSNSMQVSTLNNKLLPSSFNNMFKPNAENHDYNTRNALNFEYPNNKLNFCDKSISYQGAKIWNNIPSHVKSSKNLNSFKTSFKQLIIANYNKII